MVGEKITNQSIKIVGWGLIYTENIFNDKESKNLLVKFCTHNPMN